MEDLSNQYLILLIYRRTDNKGNNVSKLRLDLSLRIFHFKLNPVLCFVLQK